MSSIRDMKPEDSSIDIINKRTCIACMHCRQRKAKCYTNYGETRCTRCVRQDRECIKPERRKYTKRVKKTDFKGKVSKLISSKDNDTSSEVNSAKKIKNKEKPSSRNQKSDTSTPIITTHGALEFLTNAAVNTENLNTNTKIIDQSKITNRKLEPFGYWELDMSIADNQPLTESKQYSAETEEFIYSIHILKSLPFLKDVLSMKEIVDLVRLFFITQHPSYPFIPAHLSNIEQLYKFPLLLLTILTISTRYQNGKYGDYSNTHSLLWDNCQQMLSKTIWASVDNFGTLGTIFAFLLFTEWNPRSIHQKECDYATISDGNTESKEFESLKRSENLSFMLAGTAVRLASSMNIGTKTGNILLALQITELNVTMNFHLNNNLNIFKIYHRNSAQYQKEYKNELEIARKYVLQGNSQTFKRWEMYIKNTQVSDDMLIQFWQDEKLLFYKHKPVPNRGHQINKSYQSNETTGIKRTLYLTRWQRAEIKILEIIKLSYETLYYSRTINSVEEPFFYNNNSFNSVSAHTMDLNDCINFLKFLQLLINGWYEEFYDLMIQMDPEKDKLVIDINSSIDLEYFSRQAELRRGEWFIIDYHYCKIYGFAIVLEFFYQKKNIILHHSNMQLIGYLRECYISCQYIHDSCVRLLKCKVICYLPIRLIGKIIRAIAFLVKMYIYFQQFKKFKMQESKKLLINLRFVKIEEILEMIKNFSKCLKMTAPDSSHLGVHYSKILKFLYEKLAKKENIDVKYEEEEEEETETVYENKTKDDMFDILFNYKDLSESSGNNTGVSDVGGFMDNIHSHNNSFNGEYREGMADFDGGLGLHNEPNIINELGLDDEHIRSKTDNNMISGVDIFDLFGTML
ncbi:Aro80 protein [Hanseniaspora uvarum]|nr:Aro80 protein [Hanseniaspora uvarum]